MAQTGNEVLLKKEAETELTRAIDVYLTHMVHLLSVTWSKKIHLLVLVYKSLYNKDGLRLCSWNPK